jgi:hypothetical protein
VPADLEMQRKLLFEAHDAPYGRTFGGKEDTASVCRGPAVGQEMRNPMDICQRMWCHHYTSLAEVIDGEEKYAVEML